MKNISYKTNTYKVFIKYTSLLQQLNSIVARKVLDWMCKNMEYNTGKVSLSTYRRQQMCCELQINNTQLSNNLKRLKDLNIISGEKGEFIINPNIFWKGDTKARTKALLSFN